MKSYRWVEVCLMGHQKHVGKMDWDRRFGAFDLDVWTGREWKAITVGVSALFTAREVSTEEVVDAFRYRSLPPELTPAPVAPSPEPEAIQAETIYANASPSEASLREWPTEPPPGAFYWFWYDKTRHKGVFLRIEDKVVFWQMHDDRTFTAPAFDSTREWFDPCASEPEVSPSWDDDNDIPF